MQWKVNGSNRAMVQIATIKYGKVVHIATLKYGIVVHGDLHPSTSFAPTIPTVHSCSSTLFYPFCFVLTSHCVFHKHVQWTAFTVHTAYFWFSTAWAYTADAARADVFTGVSGWCPLLGANAKRPRKVGRWGIEGIETIEKQLAKLWTQAD